MAKRSKDTNNVTQEAPAEEEEGTFTIPNADDEGLNQSGEGSGENDEGREDGEGGSDDVLGPPDAGADSDRGDGDSLDPGLTIFDVMFLDGEFDGDGVLVGAYDPTAYPVPSFTGKTRELISYYTFAQPGNALVSAAETQGLATNQGQALAASDGENPALGGWVSGVKQPDVILGIDPNARV